MSTQKRTNPLIFTIVIFILLISACVPISPTVQMATNPCAKQSKMLLQAKDSRKSAEIILMGSDEIIKSIADANGLRPISENNQVSLASLRPFLPESLSSSDTVIAAYQGDFPQLLQSLKENPQNVAVDLNYVVNPVETSANGDLGGYTWQVGGGTWQVGGGTWQVGGGAYALAAANQWLNADHFWKQWIFSGTSGVAPGLSFEPGSSDRDLLGDGTLDAAEMPQIETNGYPKGPLQVGIFDSAPLLETKGDVVVGLPLPLNLKVHDFLPGIDYISPVSVAPGEAIIDVRDHGLFAAGLIYGVAPASEMHLYRVLDNCVQGKLFTLLQAISQFADEQMAGKEEKSLNGAVLNLSLGITNPKDVLDPDELELLKELSNNLGYTNPSGNALSLQAVMDALNNAGAIVVGAAGNDGVGNSSRFPAAYESVVGVSASNIAAAQSCFSNNGDMMLPNSDGSTDTGSCTPPSDAQWLSCQNDPAQCPYGAISLMTQSYSGFGYWVGTSFAAPLATGSSVLLLEKAIKTNASPPGDAATVVKSHLSLSGEANTPLRLDQLLQQIP